MSDGDNAGNAPTPETHQGPPSPAAEPNEQQEPGSHGAENRQVELEETREPASRADEEPKSESGRLQGAIEAILLAADKPIGRGELLSTFDSEDERAVDRALERLELEFSGSGRGIHLEKVADGYQLRTNPDYHPAVTKHVEANPISLSRAAMEVLAVVAYRQPVTRAEIEEIRGVDSSGVIRTLTDCDLVRVIGRLDDLGRPHVYGTTDRFLELFGLDDLTELPTLSEDEYEALEELYEDELDRFDDEFE